MLGLRLTREGVTEERFRARFGVSFGQAYGNVIRRVAGPGIGQGSPHQAGADAGKPRVCRLLAWLTA